MTYSWQNEDGEPIMDGAAWRFEQQLDMDSAADYYEDHFYDGEDEAPCEIDPSACTGDDLDYVDDITGECSWCGKRWPFDWTN